MPRGKLITRETVERVYKLREMMPSIKADEVAEIITDISSKSADRILRGEYDHLLPSGVLAKSNEDVIAVLSTITDMMAKNNALLADIATMLVNKNECLNHVPSKASEAHFRGQIKANRIERKEEE